MKKRGLLWLLAGSGAMILAGCSGEGKSEEIFSGAQTAGERVASVFASGSGEEAKGEASPEEALKQFVDALAQMDFDRILAAYPAETIAGNATLEVVGYYDMLNFPLPDTSEGNRKLNAEKQKNDYLRTVNLLILDLFSPEDFDRDIGNTYQGELEQVDISSIRDLTMVSAWEDMEWKDYVGEKRAEYYKAKTAAAYCMELELEGERYVAEGLLLQYGDDWYIIGWQMLDEGCYVNSKAVWEAYAGQ